MVYLVFGGAGYIGSHIVAKLLQSQKNVIVVDNFSNSFSSIFQNMPNLENLTVFSGDISEYKYSEIEKVEAVFHCAGYKNIPNSFRSPLEYYENNIGATCRALEILVDSGCDTFIFSGSAAVYGVSPSIGSSESDEVNPLSPYARTKVICEQIIRDFSKNYPEKRFLTLRYFNVYGGIETPKKQELSLIPALQYALSTNTSFKLFGTDYQTVDGTCVHDFIHISDLVNGHLAALLYTPKGYHVFNLGSGERTSIREFVNAFKIKYPLLRIEAHTRREGDSPFLYANISKARVELRWSPQISFSPASL